MVSRFGNNGVLFHSYSRLAERGDDRRKGTKPEYRQFQLGTNVDVSTLRVPSGTELLTWSCRRLWPRGDRPKNRQWRCPCRWSPGATFRHDMVTVAQRFALKAPLVPVRRRADNLGYGSLAGLSDRKSESVMRGIFRHTADPFALNKNLKIRSRVTLDTRFV